MHGYITSLRMATIRPHNKEMIRHTAQVSRSHKLVELPSFLNADEVYRMRTPFVTQHVEKQHGFRECLGAQDT